MQVRFVFGWWIHYKLGALAVDAATFFVMLGLGNDTPFHDGSIQKYSFNFILLLDLLPKKDFVLTLIIWKLSLKTEILKIIGNLMKMPLNCSSMFHLHFI